LVGGEWKVGQQQTTTTNTLGAVGLVASCGGRVTVDRDHTPQTYGRVQSDRVWVPRGTGCGREAFAFPVDDSCWRWGG
jgi:hypothetical protein